MATYTVELRNIWEDMQIGDALTSYPIYDEEHRERLNNLIRDHYWYREIGVETPGMFAFFLKRKLNEIMPYYNQLFESTELKFDPLLNVVMTAETTSEDQAKTTSKADNNTTSNTTGGNKGSVDGSSRATVQQFPQMQLSNNGDYATSATDTISSNKTDTETTADTNTTTADTASGETNSTGNASSTSKGLSGVSASQLLQQFRDAMLNVDMLVVEALEPLFMQVWATDTDYSADLKGF